MAVEDAYELAYREAVRALEHQRAAATELRSRAGMLLATASITISLLGQEMFDSQRSLTWAVILCFALLSVCVLTIVWPRADWNFDLDPQALIEARLSTDELVVIDLTLDLIAHMGAQWRANGHRLVRVVQAFRVGACLLAIQIVLTIVAAGVRL